jgi:alkanesulfonate monooxygenase SsuD/methylene tetrahydromethanopterin reductase-like flavin-dependent oxidoreductase (luciferase family)
MKFDVFHSIGRIDSVSPRLGDAAVFRQFFRQLGAAEALGFGTMWVAESHFSSEVQKHNPEPVIPNYHGEVGLNADSMQLAQVILERTQRIGFGTAIFNIVGGNGGPLAAADRVRSLAWLNHLRDTPRRLDIGIASGRFPYINRPFGIVPRDAAEREHWREVQRYVFAEALEIFLRLTAGDTLGSADVELYKGKDLPFGPRWQFERLKLVPEMPSDAAGAPRFVLGSADPLARDHAMRFADLDIFNLSFTPPDAINKTHAEMTKLCAAVGRTWHRARMPRTVLVFIDKDAKKARARADAAFDTYIEAMRGTAQVPDKQLLMDRALIGDSAMVRAQLAADDPHGFHADDRLMLWFEFNQTDGDAILAQMRQFGDDVMPHYQ